MKPQVNDSERGSISIWLIASAFVMIVIVGIAVDLTGHAHAQQAARAAAAQAARAGGQQINEPAGVRGDPVTANPEAAVAAAQNHLAQAGVVGSARVEGTRIVVTAQTTYNTKFLSIIGIGSLSATGTADSRIVRVVDGSER